MILNILKKELATFSKSEKIIFPAVIALIVIISLVLKDNKLAAVSAICGISYTVLAGKGKIYCYYIGILGTLCYSIIAYNNGFYGNLALYSLYYFPMEITGIINWRKHLNQRTNSIVKTKLHAGAGAVYLTAALIISAGFALILKKTGGHNPVIDSFTMVFSVLGQFLTVKRCIEQWYVWFLVNLLSLILWISAYLNGSQCFATILMWAVYLFLSVYFYSQWNKEINKKIKKI